MRIGKDNGTRALLASWAEDFLCAVVDHQYVKAYGYSERVLGMMFGKMVENDLTRYGALDMAMFELLLKGGRDFFFQEGENDDDLFQTARGDGKTGRD